jgi:SAM-dependent methyltransferase
MPEMSETPDTLRRVVRETYAKIARGERSGCGPTSSGSCCGPSSSTAMGYAEDDLARLPRGADLGLGCGNPGALAELREGETVLDLGSGAGIDCFLAAERVGAAGHVIGVDMTPDMIERARENARKLAAGNVEFRLGEIEHLPVADASVDAVISNCVVNLSPDKAAVFREVFRVLKPGGRVAISDIVAVQDIPEEVRRDPATYAGCVSGAVDPAENEAMLRAAGFTGVAVDVAGRAEGLQGFDFVRSASVRAVKPE